MSDRVKYYSPIDLSIGHYLPRVKDVITTHSENNYSILNFDDAIELNNSIKFIENGHISVDWDEKFVNDLHSIKLKIIKKINYFFNTRSADLIINYMLNLRETNYYIEEFFEIFSKYKYADKISEQVFCDVYYEINISIRYLLRNDYFIDSYPDFMRELFLAKSKHLEILLDNFSMKHGKIYSIPKKIPTEEWNELLVDYINGEDVNINYLRLLQKPIKSMSNKFFRLSDEIKYEIQKKVSYFNESFNITKAGLQVVFEVYSNKKLFEEKRKEYQDIMVLSPIELIEKSIIQSLLAQEEKESITIYFTALVDYNKIQRNHKFENLLNIISNDTDIFSEFKMLQLPSFPNKEIMGISNSIGLKSKGDYLDTNYFHYKNKLVSYKLIVYQKIFQEFELSFEKIYKWYFEEFLKNQYGIEWLKLNFLSINDTIDNKISTNFRIEESIRKQYSVFTSLGKIDRDMYNLKNTPKISVLGSKISKKYAYISKEKNVAMNIAKMIFSDQSSLNYIDEERNARNFIELITKYKIQKEDFLIHEQNQIMYLIDNNIVTLFDGSLAVGNKVLLDILKKLYYYEEISYYNSNFEEKRELDNLFEKNWIYFESTLFSKKESEYMNYLLNDSQFDNSLGIRNSYQHGAPAYELDEEYQFDYTVSLLIILIYIVKIEEELKYIGCLK